LKNKKMKAAVQTPPPGPTLLEFWLDLKKANAAPSAAENVSSHSGAAEFFPSSAGSSGSGSGGAGYGLRLIVPDPDSQERIRRIMRELCERDAKRAKRKSV